MAGLEDLYKEIIIDHYRSPRNKGELRRQPPGPKASTRSAETRSLSISMLTTTGSSPT